MTVRKVVLVLVAGLVAFVVIKEVPELQRYRRMRQM